MWLVRHLSSESTHPAAAARPLLMECNVHLVSPFRHCYHSTIGITYFSVELNLTST